MSAFGSVPILCTSDASYLPRSSTSFPTASFDGLAHNMVVNTRPRVFPAGTNCFPCHLPRSRAGRVCVILKTACALGVSNSIIWDCGPRSRAALWPMPVRPDLLAPIRPLLPLRAPVKNSGTFAVVSENLRPSVICGSNSGS